MGNGLAKFIAGNANISLRSIARGACKLKPVLADDLLGDLDRPEPEVARLSIRIASSISRSSFIQNER